MGKDWDAVAAAINTRMEELELTQRELAERSGVSPATLRQLQHNYAPKRRSSRLLAAVSQGLRWPADHLAHVLEGNEPERTDANSLRGELRELRGELSELRARVAALEEERP